METKALTKINEVALLVVTQNKEKFVPIKPICQILGVQYQAQFNKLKEDNILSSVISLRDTTGADGKVYQMSCLPYKYIFGWLFRINANNVKPEAKETLVKYQKMCYDILYNHFTEAQTFLEEKFEIVSQVEQEEKKIKENFASTKNELKKVQKKLTDIKKMTLEQWKAEDKQFSIWGNTNNSDDVDELLTEYLNTHLDILIEKYNGYIDLLWLFTNFKTEYRNSFSAFQRSYVYATTTRFKRLVEKYCEANNYQFNPKERLNQPKENPTRIIKQSGIRNDRNDIGVMAEHIYVEKPHYSDDKELLERNII